MRRKFSDKDYFKENKNVKSDFKNILKWRR